MSKKAGEIGWCSDLGDAAQDLEFGVAITLHDIAFALKEVGNPQLAERLHLLASRIVRDARQVRDGTSAVVSVLLKRSNEASDNMLNASLVGAKLAGTSIQALPDKSNT